MSDGRMYWSQPLLYVALGDSLTVGVGANYHPGFVPRYQRMIEEQMKQRVFVQMYARPGATTGEILALMNNPQVKFDLSRATIITLSAGGNDFIQAAEKYLKSKEKKVLEEALHAARNNIAAIINHIRNLKADSKSAYMIRVLDLYNPMPQVAIVDKWVRLFNRHIRKCCAQGNIGVTNLYAAFKDSEERLLSADKIHPNQQGYQVIAEELNKLGYASLH